MLGLKSSVNDHDIYWIIFQVLGQFFPEDARDNILFPEYPGPRCGVVFKMMQIISMGSQ
jgi:hypothetical protein